MFLSFQDEGADLPFAPPLRNELYLVPSGVRPVLQRTAIEVNNLRKIIMKRLNSKLLYFICHF